MEASAIRDGLRLAMDLGFRKVILESYAQEVVRMINVANFERADIASICYEVEELRFLRSRACKPESKHSCA